MTLANVAEGLRPCPESPFLGACPKLPQPQSDTVTLVIRITASFVPTVLALISIYFKTRFPIKRNGQLDKILQGIEMHCEDEDAEDPLTGKHINIVRPSTDMEQQSMWIMEMWGAAIGGSPQVLRKVLDANKGEEEVAPSTWESAVRRGWFWVGATTAIVAAAISATVATFPLLESQTVSWVPTTLCLCSGATVVLLIVAVMRVTSIRAFSTARDGRKVTVAFLAAMLDRGDCRGNTA